MVFLLCVCFFPPAQLRAEVKSPSGEDYCLHIHLLHPVVPEQSTYKILSTKVCLKESVITKLNFFKCKQIHIQTDDKFKKKVTLSVLVRCRTAWHRLYNCNCTGGIEHHSSKKNVLSIDVVMTVVESAF